jgi:hypothetical protein
LLQLFDISTLYSKINMVDLRVGMKVLIYRVFGWM